MPGYRGVAFVIACAVLTACNNAPNQNFEQSMKDRDAKYGGDAYSSLERSMPRLQHFIRTQRDQQQEFANGQSGEFRATYDGLLSTLDADKKVDRSSALFTSCRSAFTEASRYQSDSGSDAAVAAPLREKAVAALKTCRNAAKSAGKDGALLARFASTGLTMIGAKTVGQGDAVRGTAIWTEGDKLVSQDKPGFELSWKTLNG